jgi:hypothetical protein
MSTKVVVLIKLDRGVKTTFTIIVGATSVAHDMDPLVKVDLM